MMVDNRPGTRRTFLGASIGALGAWAAAAMGRPPAARADDGQNLKLGQSNSCGTQGTSLSNLVNADAEFASNKTGVWGASPATSGFGMQGYVSGIEGTAVRGQTSGHYSQIGVDGDATNGNGEGIGVRARTKNGVGLFARSQGGYAIQVEGLAVFSRSGKLTFSAGQASRTVSGHSLIDGSIVVATIQGDVAGTWVRGVTVNANNDTFTIRLNKAAPKQLRVGWFIVN